MIGAGTLRNWRQLPPGEELDAVVTEAMEPRATLPTITAHEARLREWGPNPTAWRWVTTDFVTSPGGWWQAHIGTDHGPAHRDHAPVRWFLSTERSPSTQPHDAWRLVEQLHARGLFLMLEQVQEDTFDYAADERPAPLLARAGEWLAHFQDVCTRGTGAGDTAPLSITRAGLDALEVADV